MPKKQSGFLKVLKSLDRTVKSLERANKKAQRASEKRQSQLFRETRKHW